MTSPLQEGSAPEKPKVSLGDLLNEIGGEKLRYQVLAHVLDGEQRTRKNGTTCFKFASMEDLGDVMAGRREALIVWTDGGEFEAARQRLIARYGPGPATLAKADATQPDDSLRSPLPENPNPPQSND